MSKNSAKHSPASFPKQYDVRVSVEQFGPIEQGLIDLRPLTIFVGPSNTGKTYLAILLYALHKTLHGFPRFPIPERYFYYEDDDASVTVDELRRVVDKIDSEKQPLLFSDLPRGMRNFSQNFLNDEMYFADDLRRELERCLDLESVTDIIRMFGSPKEANLSISVKDEEKTLWEFLMSITDDSISSRGKIHDMELLSERHGYPRSSVERITNLIRRLIESTTSQKRNTRLAFLTNELWELLVRSTRDQQVDSHYLPAARSGIMQSHRVIASSLVARSTRAGLEHFPELPTFSGVMADFMQRLILYEAHGSHVGHRPHRKRQRALEGLADDLERRTLGGQIRANRPSPSGYPEFVYRPLQAKRDIRLSRASSMVSELAPVVLFIRGNVTSGDTLIIEEPEAHLHPTAQTQVAATLARLVKCGIRVIVTTHSDWLLKAVSNLMREGELEEETGESALETFSAGSLRPQDVGIWLFHRPDPAQGSRIREIEFDRIEGIEPSDYEDVAEELYNRSADLQNLFEEVTKKGDQTV